MRTRTRRRGRWSFRWSQRPPRRFSSSSFRTFPTSSHRCSRGSPRRSDRCSARCEKKISRPTKRVLTLNQSAISSPLPSAENPRRKTSEQRRDQSIVFTGRRDRLQAENRSARAPRGAGRIAARRYGPTIRTPPERPLRRGFLLLPRLLSNKRCPARCRAGRPGSRGRAPRVLRSRPEARGPPEGTERACADHRWRGGHLGPQRRRAIPIRAPPTDLSCIHELPRFPRRRVPGGERDSVASSVTRKAPPCGACRFRLFPWIHFRPPRRAEWQRW